MIAATVRNALTQGCERVLLVDNDSPDDTVAAAIDAGAELATSFSTPSSTSCSRSACSTRPSPRCRRRRRTTTSGGCGSTPTSSSTARAARRCVSWWRRWIAGSGSSAPATSTTSPTAGPSTSPGCHPLDFQPLVRGAIGEPLPRSAIASTTSSAGIAPGRRSRRGSASTPPAPTSRSSSRPSATFTHHFPYRLEEVTRRRFDALCGRDDSGRVAGRSLRPSGPAQRRDGLGHVQAGPHARRTCTPRDWASIENLRRAGNRLGVDPRPWADAVDAARRAGRAVVPAGRAGCGHRRVAPHGGRRHDASPSTPASRRAAELRRDRRDALRARRRCTSTCRPTPTSSCRARRSTSSTASGTAACRGTDAVRGLRRSAGGRRGHADLPRRSGRPRPDGEHDPRCPAARRAARPGRPGLLALLDGARPRARAADASRRRSPTSSPGGPVRRRRTTSLGVGTLRQLEQVCARFPRAQLRRRAVRRPPRPARTRPTPTCAGSSASTTASSPPPRRAGQPLRRVPLDAGPEPAPLAAVDVADRSHRRPAQRPRGRLRADGARDRGRAARATSPPTTRRWPTGSAATCSNWMEPT